MKTYLPRRDWEALSAYLDHQLSKKEQTRLETRLQVEAGLRQALEELRRTRLVLRATPRLRVPHGFTLSVQQARVSQPARAFTTLRYASIVASLIFVIAILGDFFTFGRPLSARQVTPAAQVAVMATEAAVEASGESAPETKTFAAEPASELPAAPEVGQTPLLATATAVTGDQSQLRAKSAAPDESAGAAPPAEAVSGIQAQAESTEMITASTVITETATSVSDATLTASENEVTAEPVEHASENADAVPMSMPAQEDATPPGRWFPWQWIEIASGLIALASGAAAYYLWRRHK